MGYQLTIVESKVMGRKEDLRPARGNNITKGVHVHQVISLDFESIHLSCEMGTNWKLTSEFTGIVNGD
jgi:hypothetical protein